MMKHLRFSAVALLLSQFALSQALTPYSTCPNADVAVARAGLNADDTNPYFLYNVNTATGAFAQVSGGPYKDPSDPSKNLQLNAIGLSKKDGFIYGLTNQNTVTTTRFVRLDRMYGVTSIGFLPSPSSTGATIGIINSAAGDVDTAGNYYYTASTINPLTGQFDKFFLGKVSNTASYGPSAGSIAVSYAEIDMSATACSAYVSTFTSDPANSGLKDFSYNAYTNSFFSYATYKATGSTFYSGQLIELKAIAGSSPLKYQLICTPVINSHTAEVAGTIIDKLGRFTVLFTDGSFGVLNRDASGVYNGTYTQIGTNVTTGLPNPLRGDMGSCGQQTFPGPPSVPVTTCPTASFIVARAGFNADIQNPYNIYTVNTTTGTPTLVPGGPLVYPNNPSVNVQVNGVGLNSADGFFYGLAFNGTTSTAEFIRFDQAYGVQSLGNITPPTSPTGVLGFVNSAAGDVDRSNNYWFTGFTANGSGASISGFALDKLFLGRLSSISTLPGTGNPAPTYFEIDYSAAGCSAYIATLSTDPGNSGLKDLVYNAVTGTFITYVTYKPTGAANFSGQVVELKPIAGSSPLKYRLTCTPVINSHTAEVAGTLIDNLGNFLVLFTDGTIGKIGSTVAFQYNGSFTVLNNTTGLPSVIRADMASCGGTNNSPLPVRLTTFAAASKDCNNILSWTSENEVAFSRYELEQSADNNTFVSVASIPSRRSASASSYKVTQPSAGRTLYYRLKMVDNNGSFAYSRTVTAANACQARAGFVINPNPAVNTLNLAWSGFTANTQLRIVILNATGSQVYTADKTISEGTSTLAIPLAGLSNGAYWIRATDAKTGASYQGNFIKQ